METTTMANIFVSVRDVIANVLIAAGAALVVYNAVVALIAFRNHQGNEVSNNLVGVVAGAGSIALAAFFKTITV